MIEIKKVAIDLLMRTQSARVLVAIAGIPGSGKSTFAENIAKELSLAGASSVVVPMDGFHYSKAQLDGMKDPAEAHRRRGAPFTFDAAALISLVSALKAHSTHSIFAPSFDHNLGDPTPQAIEIPSSTRFIILEGLYLHLSFSPWNELTFDERWFLLCDEDVAINRLVFRHVKTSVAKNEAEAIERILGSDMVNGRIVLENRVACDLEFEN
ncbi:hypothetical protein HK100_000503 [Physocladia obscura]|uniref:Phosphoribulokinase/uridine kinase domain-containing protein n=1 Tax=Physocladia obscura TaxID=109957 RepID=A0AAD5TAK7_9FUNG|nr:hypothetical protein HK100_000503 [Physocladia obscura]